MNYAEKSYMVVKSARNAAYIHCVTVGAVNIN